MWRCAAATGRAPWRTYRGPEPRDAAGLAGTVHHSTRLAGAGLGGLHRRSAAPRLVVDQRIDCGVFAAKRAGLVLTQLELAETHVLAFEEKVAPDHRPPDVQQVLDRFEGTHAADYPGQHADHAGLGAALHAAGRRRLREQAAVAAGALGGIEKCEAPFETEDAPVHQRLGQEVRGVVRQVASREVIGPVHDDVVGGKDAQGGLRVEVLVDRDDLDVGIEVAERLGRRLDLGPADVVVTVQELALKVGGVDGVEVDDSDLADAGRRQVHGRGRAKPAGAQEEHARVEQLALPRATYFGQDQVPRVAGDLVGGEGSVLGHLPVWTIPRVLWGLFL